MARHIMVQAKTTAGKGEFDQDGKLVVRNSNTNTCHRDSLERY